MIEHLGRDDPSFFTLWMEAAAAARGALRLPEAQGFPHTCAQYSHIRNRQRLARTRQSKQCGFSIYIFENSKSKSMVRSEKMALSGLVFARKIARMILIQNI